MASDGNNPEVTEQATAGTINLSELTITANQTEVTEGNIATFTVKRTGDGDTSKAVTVNWTVTGSTNNSATEAADANDFTGDSLPSGSLTFGPNETEKPIKVQTKNDGKIEKTEGFTVTLSGEKNATISQNQASSSITDNDKLSLSLHKDSGKEGDDITNVNKVNVHNVPAGQEWEYRIGKTGDWKKSSDNHQLTLPDNNAIRGKEYTVQARVKGIDSSLVEKEFTYDKLTYLDNVDFDKDGSSIVVVGKAEPGATIEVGQNSTTVAKDGTFKLKLPSTNASKGFINLTVKTTDIAGNTESQTHSVRQVGNIFKSEFKLLKDEINSRKNTTIIVGEKGDRGDVSGFELVQKRWRKDDFLDFGDGDDALIVAGAVHYGADVRMGVGDDTVRIKSYMREGAKIDMGAGNDYIKLGDKSLGTGNNLDWSKKSMSEDASLKLGAGNDTAELMYRMDSSSKLDGGTGFDTLNFTGSGVYQGLDVITGMEVINLTGTGGNTLTVKKSDVLNNADTATTINGKSYKGLFINGNNKDTVDLGANGSPRIDKLGGFVKDTRKGQAPEGYDAYWDGSDDKTHVFIQKGIEVI